MGRFFDAVAFVLGYEKPIFEGENLLCGWRNFAGKVSHRFQKLKDYLKNDEFENIPTKKLFSKILEKKSGKSAGEIGLNFHYTFN